MRKPFFFAFALLAFCAGLAGASELRESLNFNRGWKFALGDKSGAKEPAFNDAKWQNVGLPHSFSTPYFAAGDRFYVGYGWYRKHFAGLQKTGGRRISLEFDGVFQVAEVFVNGRNVGEHKGGYTGFTLDITDAVKPGDNVVAVRVNNFWNARIAPRAGEHTFSGGIYRDVRLLSTAPLHVAWYGTFVTTPKVSKDSGVVNVKTEVDNDSSVSKSATLRTLVLDASGTVVAQMESTQNIAANSSGVFDQSSAPVAHPKLWSPENPNLYSVKTIVLDGSDPVDDFLSPLGFRWFNFDAKKGFFLNGEHRYFKGANVHQDHAGWGDAVADSGFHRDVKLVKDAGFDFIRGSHYPHAPSFAKACDEIGILFWSENCFWGTAGAQSPWSSSAYPTNPADEPEFEASVKASLRDMIRINRNHPSIIVWSMDNEVFFSDSMVMPKVQRFLKELVAYSHQLDSTRPAAIGGCQRGGIDKLGDVAGYNGDGARLPEYQDPGIPNVITEYGSTMVDRPGTYEPGWGDLPGTAGANASNPTSWRLPWRSGEVIWCAFDHGSIAGRQFGGMGMVDYFRLPKRQWYWYRNEYLHVPPPVWPVEGVPAALKLSADKTTLAHADGTDDAQVIVSVVDKDGRALSNCPEVTLAVESGPGEFPTGSSISFDSDSDIAIRDGMAAMEFRSYYAGKTVIRATSPGLKAATLEITTIDGPPFDPAKTPKVSPRPYVRFIESSSDVFVTLGRDNPTRSSSQAPEHSSRLANDGDPATFWQAAVGDAKPWLRIDLERLARIREVKLAFPSAGRWRYKIEVSEDGEKVWKMFADETQTESVAKERVTVAQDALIRGRYLRVTITSTPGTDPAAVSELEASGIVASTSTAPAWKPEAPAAGWRIRCGGDNFTDHAGRIWLSDRLFDGGSTAFNGRTITAAEDPELYQTERWGQNFNYRFPMKPGKYQVTLKFAEGFMTGPGQRVFGVEINSKKVLEHFDIFKETGGQDRGIDKVFKGIRPNAKGFIVLRFIAEIQNPKVDAIEISKQE